MMHRRFGHVGDPPQSETVRLTIGPSVKVPQFDQAHVDYLKEIFTVLANEAPNGSPEVVFGWVHEVKGERRVIDHIQSLIHERNSR